MKERLITLGLAVAALVLFYALFLPKPPPENLSISRPLSSDLGAAGYQAAWRWLNSERIPVVSLRDRFEYLLSKTPRATGNVLITTLPHKLPVRPDEASRLDAWIERGNTLVIAAALDDTPTWSLEGAERLTKDVARLARLKLDSSDEKEERPKSSSVPQTLQAALKALSASRLIAIEPRGIHPLMKGVRALQVGSDLPSARWLAAPTDSSGVLQVAQLAQGGNAAIWIKPQRDGQIILLGVAGLFSNRDLANADNAQLLANVIGWSREAGSAVIFDDVHQGAVDYYDAKAFFKDPRLHRTLWWLVLLWFIFILGMQRFRGHAQDKAAADVTTFVSGSGDFLASALTPPAAGARLLMNFFNSIHRRLGTREDGSPVWDWLSAQAAVGSNEIGELQQLASRIESGRRFNLPRLQNLLSQLQGKIV